MGVIKGDAWILAYSSHGLCMGAPTSGCFEDRSRSSKSEADVSVVYLNPKSM